MSSYSSESETDNPIQARLNQLVKEAKLKGKLKKPISSAAPTVFPKFSAKEETQPRGRVQSLASEECGSVPTCTSSDNTASSTPWFVDTVGNPNVMSEANQVRYQDSWKSSNNYANKSYSKWTYNHEVVSETQATSPSLATCPQAQLLEHEQLKLELSNKPPVDDNCPLLSEVQKTEYLKYWNFYSGRERSTLFHTANRMLTTNCKVRLRENFSKLYSKKFPFSHFFFHSFPFRLC